MADHGWTTQGGYQQPAYAAAPGGPPEVRYGIGAGLVLGLIGMVLVALSLFGFDWAKGSGTRFTDFTSNAHKLHPTKFTDIGQHLDYVYVSWLAYVLFAVVLILVVLAGIPLPHTGAGNRYWRVAASLLAGLAAVQHSMTVTYVFTNSGQDAGFGALAALVGYFLVMLGMIFGARRIVRPAARFR